VVSSYSVYGSKDTIDSLYAIALECTDTGCSFRAVIACKSIQAGIR